MKKSIRKISVLVLVALLMSTFAPASYAEAASKVFIAYQQTEDGRQVNKIKKSEAEKYKVTKLCLDVGEEQDLCYINAPKRKNVKWTSSNTKVVKVNKVGLVTAVGEGTAKVTLSYKPLIGKKVSLSIDVVVQSNLQQKMDKLIQKLGVENGKTVYFTVNQKACSSSRVSGHGCTNCNVGDIIATNWFEETFGTINTSLFPAHDVDEYGRDNAGKSCFGFACFAQWYVYAKNNTDKVTAQNVANVKFNKAELQANVKQGDILRVNGHSVLVYSVEEDGMQVIDCNWNMGNQLNCVVQKHFLPYTIEYCAGHVVYVNRVVDVTPGKTEEPENTNKVQSVENGFYVISPKCAPNSALDVADFGYQNGTNIQIWEKTGRENQVFYLMKNSNGSYVIKSSSNPSMVLDVEWGYAESGANVQLYENNATTAQSFYLEAVDGGYFMIVSALNKELALDIQNASSDNGTNVWLYEKNNSDAQLFSIQKIDGVNVNMERIALDVPLYVQETTKTCGVASVRMIADYLDLKNSSGDHFSEAELWKWANSGGQGDYVYRVKDTLVHCGVSYVYKKMNTTTSEETYWNEMKGSLQKDRPVIVVIQPTKNNYWKYASGHYVLVTGAFIDENGVKQVIINDCHYQYSEKGKIVPLKELLRVNLNHSGYIIVAK